ncbi:gamma-glutamyltransferase [Plantactinospora sp. KLBMP9567]|uniref:gamma-glutamyltransferase n=1 Tax=Plantactinospora sp. KLBMP9567 TaxID=3085900 RepID=UPI0029813E4F|nr:gamma-glutamyltransferase [Plantactinospora sp. KLBMP9567]MDW5325703.1 gamma-glutamyltransferase [Plantactinospora sp. KLBMP9567]
MRLTKRATSRMAVTVAVAVALVAASPPASAAPGAAGQLGAAPKTPTARGYGGAVSTVDPTATAVGLEVLRRGGNAVDAAVAAAATLGVTEPFSAGIGGGGFLVYYDAGSRRVHTVDGRESAPASIREDSFVDPATGTAYPFQQARVSGLSVGVPGTLMTWQEALRRWGSRPLAAALAPAVEVAERGFAVDPTFRQQVAENAAAFAQFDATRKLYLPGGQPPAVGTTLRNRDLADTYRQIARSGVDVFYTGPIGADLVAAVRRPPVATDPAVPWQFPIQAGGMTRADLARYELRFPAPTRSDYRGYQVYGMSTPSSGGVAVGEALNILERFDLSKLTVTEALHHYLEASALAFADRNRYVADGTSRRILGELLDDRYAAERACRLDPARAAPKPVPPGDPDGRYGDCATAAAGAEANPGRSTTNLTVADRWGNVVEYTLTIEQTGGNAMVVPGRGFLLNNELTDFTFAQTPGAAPDPNLPGPGKRPRSSMSPTIVLDDGRPFLALGTPGGATIITTVLQILVNRIDLGMSLPQALAAPRASQRNSAAPQAEPAFVAAYGGALGALGHPAFAVTAELGAATAIEFTGRHGLLASAEPVRRGGGAAGVVQPGRWAASG